MVTVTGGTGDRGRDWGEDVGRVERVMVWTCCLTSNIHVKYLLPYSLFIPIKCLCAILQWPYMVRYTTFTSHECTIQRYYIVSTPQNVWPPPHLLPTPHNTLVIIILHIIETINTSVMMSLFWGGRFIPPSHYR